MKIALAGAFGFVGQHLLEGIIKSTEHEVIALTRNQRSFDNPRITCRSTDLYSLKEATAGLADCQAAIYLVHSMAPASRLFQGHFRDLDFILADNFGRAAKANGIDHLIYVGGMIPEGHALSHHLSSRWEVEQVLTSHQIPLTIFRCGLVIGYQASSFAIIENLTKRLPIMILPKWMRTPSNPIYVEDLVDLLIQSIDEPAQDTRIIDAGMDEAVTYKDMVIETAKIFGKSPLLIDVPYVAPMLSKFWVCLVSGIPKALVYPLIDSVKAEMIKSYRYPVPATWQVGITPLSEAIKGSFTSTFRLTKAQNTKSIKAQSEVRSVQRVPLPKSYSAKRVADCYLAWMPFYLKPILNIKAIEQGCQYRLRWLGWLLLTLHRQVDKSSDQRQLFFVGDGLLVNGEIQGRFEFRESPNRDFVIIALHRFKPAIPWPIYRWTQAIVHKIVMNSFGRYLAKLEKKMANSKLSSEDSMPTLTG